MSKITENEMRKQARKIAKEVSSMGSPYGPDEAAYYGMLWVDMLLGFDIKMLEGEVKRLEDKIASLTKDKK